MGLSEQPATSKGKDQRRCVHNRRARHRARNEEVLRPLKDSWDLQSIHRAIGKPLERSIGNAPYHRSGPIRRF